MADNIVRLKVDSAEYDSKIKRAAQGMHALEEKVRKMSATFEVAEKEDLEFVRALGQMETVSRSAKGKVGELTAAFTDLKSQYNRLTEEEKKSPFGKALAGSLDQLKGRIAEGKKELESINKELGNTSSEGEKSGNVLENLAGKFGLNIGQMSKFAIGAGAVTTALKVAKDAFFASEENLDEWERTVRAANTTYEAFLTSINTGDISGFLSRIDQIVSAAREAANEMDRLGTQKVVNNKKYQQQQTENERFRTMLRTGRYIAPTDGRAPSAGMKNGQLLTDAQKSAIAKQLENGLKKVNQITVDEIGQTTRTINALYKEQASVLGISQKEFEYWTQDMKHLDDAISGYKKYKNWENTRDLEIAKAQNPYYKTNFDFTAKNPYESYKWAGVFKDDGDLFLQINDLINQRASLQTQNYSAQASAFRAINKAGNAGGRGGGRHGGRGGQNLSVTTQALNLKELAGVDSKIVELGEDFKHLTNAVVNGKSVIFESISGAFQMPSVDSIKREISAYQKMFNESTSQSEKLKLQAYIATDQSLLEALQAPEDWTIDENGVRIPVKLEMPKSLKDNKGLDFSKPADAAKETGKAWQAAAQAINSAGGAIQNMDSQGAKVAGIVAQAVANIALGFAQASASPATGASGVFGWIAAATAGLATMTATIASIKSQTKGFAEGGILGGQNYSGDVGTYAFRANASEMIINQSDQRALYDAIHSGNLGGGGNGSVMIRGEELYVPLRNYMRRTNKTL